MSTNIIRLPLQAYLYRKQALNKSGMNTPYTLPVLQHAPSKRVLSCGKCDNVFADVNTSQGERMSMVQLLGEVSFSRSPSSPIIEYCNSQERSKFTGSIESVNFDSKVQKERKRDSKKNKINK